MALRPAQRCSGSRGEAGFWIIVIWLLVAGVGGVPAWGETVVGPGTSGERFGKVIHQYALTSANDFPQRDPTEWRLLGSNDGGKTWVTLDARKDEFFQERHQRKLFKIANEKAFETYRLEVDRIRDRRGANSVQLAEIELMGRTEDDLDPVPAFADIITTQGDNPPSETVAKVFDGHVETKWLDRPTNRVTCATWIQWQYASPAGTVITNASQLLALRARASAGYRVQIEGVVEKGPEGSGWFLVIDSTGCFELRGVQEAEQLKTGQHVLVEGVSEWAENRVGVGKNRVRARGPNPPVAPERFALEQPMGAGEELKWVEIEGEIQFRRHLGDEPCFDLQEGALSMRVRMRRSANAQLLPPSGTRVAVRGICRGAMTDKGQWVASELWSLGLEALLVVDQKSRGSNPANASPQTKASGSVLTTLTTIEQIRRLSLDQLNSRPLVKIRGVVTDLVGAFIQDDTAGIQVAFPDDESRKITEPCMFLEVEGRCGVGDVGNPVISAEKVRVLGKGKLPQPQRLSLSQLMSGRMDAQWIEMEGVVRSTDGAHLLMICSGREVMASIGAGAAAVVKGLVDAAVRVRGVGITALDDRGRIKGIHVLIPSLEQVEVLEPPQDPFSLPIQPIGGMLGLSGPRESFHRVRVEGVVTLQENQKLFLRDDTGSAMAIFKEDVVLDARFGRSRWLFWRSPQTNATFKSDLKFSPGDRLQVVGFPETRGYSPVLTEVSVRKTGGPAVLKPVEATAGAIADGRLDSTLVTLEGVVLGQNTLGAQVALAVEWADRRLQVLIPAPGDFPTIAPGTRLQVTGVCQIDPVPYAELGLRVGLVRILTRSRADLVVLARPPWWTVRRALAVIGGMTFVILAALIWIKQLRHQVEERSIQLTTEIQRREQIERQRALEEERARIAQDLHDDLGAALTQIRFLSAVESRDAAVPEGTRSRLRQVSEKSHHLVTSLDEIVWAINPANDSLPKLANYLCHVAEEFFLTTPIRCRLDVDESLPSLALTSEVRHNLYLSVREGLNNIAKHSGATEVWLRILWKAGALHIIIEDNGCGFVEAEALAAGQGLPNMRRRLEKIGGRFESVSNPGSGTSCQIWLPLRFPDSAAKIHPFR
jgi:signal transduction histidine kinase